LKNEYDYIIIGAGIIGLTLALELKKKQAKTNIVIIEKESEVAFHASGRNSGVLHAGFYYPSDSLKAKFTINGNLKMQEFCTRHKLKLNRCGKLVLAKNELELKQLEMLYKRGLANGSEVELISEENAKKIDKNIITYQKALYSPRTAVVDPREVCYKLKELLEQSGVEILLSTKYYSRSAKSIKTNKGILYFNKLINAAGLYADKIAKDFSLSKNYTMLPFRGNYIKVKTDPLEVNLYPVPDLNYPFLGTHFTVTIQNEIKIGPTATPAFWRENYKGFSRFKLLEFLEILRYELVLIFQNKFHFRDLAIDEIKKYNKSYLLKSAKLLRSSELSIDKKNQIQPGIRAQLLNTKTKELVNDFLIEENEYSLHILNSVSPAFTCSFAFSEYIVEKHLKITSTEA
jgi:(S)-2-hydroxyglutarate dehydrogenase